MIAYDAFFCSYNIRRALMSVSTASPVPETLNGGGRGRVHAGESSMIWDDASWCVLNNYLAASIVSAVCQKELAI